MNDLYPADIEVVKHLKARYFRSLDLRLQHEFGRVSPGGLPRA